MLWVGLWSQIPIPKLHQVAQGSAQLKETISCHQEAVGQGQSLISFSKQETKAECQSFQFEEKWQERGTGAKTEHARAEQQQPLLGTYFMTSLQSKP